MNNKSYISKVLTIAGSDSVAGAGIQADIKTCGATGTYAASVITALTAQNTKGIVAIEPVSLSMIENQFLALTADIKFDAVKIGMLPNIEAVQLIAKLLKAYPQKNIVLDTVFASTSGKTFLDHDAIQAMIHDLIPLCDLITPNIPEAEILLNNKVIERNTMRDSAVRLGIEYEVSVLLKGGHLPGRESKDYLFIDINNEVHQFAAPTIETNNTHGTGCTLSSCIASFLAQGNNLEDSVKLSKAYITQAIIAGKDFSFGNGKGPLQHFF